MKLRDSPYSIFKNKKTPVSLYARKKWLGESDTDEWKIDFDITVSEILYTKYHTDSSPLSMIHKLFDLHLTVRDKTPEIEESLNRLLEKADIIFSQKEKTMIPDNHLDGLPFAGLENCYTIPPAALFIASVFDEGRNPLAEKLYKKLIIFSEKNINDRHIIKFQHNLFRALAVNPDYTESKAAVSILKLISSIQRGSGDWEGRIPFYQMINAAAHLHTKESELLLQKSTELIINSQNSDGSWGKDQKEWNTFLTVHALKNMAVI